MSKLSKKPSARQKFSFELSRFKSVSSKTNGRSSKDHGASEAELPSPLPKSVRPPLSPEIDEQLRQACTYVLQDFKPSHKLYEEHYGKNREVKPQPNEYKPYHQLRKEHYGETQNEVRGLGERSLSRSTKEQMDLAGASTMTKPSVREQPKPRGIDQKEIEELTLGIPKMKPTIKSQAFFEGLHLDPPTLGAHPQPEFEDNEPDEAIDVDLSNFNPPIASQVFFNGVDLDRIRKATAAAIQEPVLPLRPRETTTQQCGTTLKRSLSNPTHSRATSGGHPSTTVRAESAETSVSTPWTESTEHSRKVSTAPTSTAITPAISSLRTSSQAAGPNSEKFLTAEVEGMRLELENHKREYEEARAKQELENQVLSIVGLETMPAHSKQSSTTSAHIVGRKPTLHSSTGSQRTHAAEQTDRTRKRQGSIQERRNVPPVPHLSGRQSGDLTRSESRRRRSTPRSESAHELEMLRPESGQSQQSRGMGEDQESSNRNMSSRDLKEYFERPSAERPTSPSSEMSRASSRSRRLFQVHGQVNEGNEVSRPSTQQSKRYSRDLSREFQQPSDHHQKPKPSVNLNRELPPLPALDQWQPIEPEKPKHISAMVSPTVGNFSRKSTAASMSEPNLLEKPEDDSLHVGSTSASTSRIHSIYSRYSKIPDDWTFDDAPPYTSMPTDADFPHSATHERFDFRDSTNDLEPLPTPPASTFEVGQRRIPSEYMFRANFGVVTSPMMPPPIPFELMTEPKTTKRRTEDMFLPDLDARARTASTDNAASEMADTTKKGQVINYSRSMRKQPSVLRKPNLVRSQTEISAPIRNDKPISHSKTTSEQINFSRKLSTDNYSRLYDMGYRNIVQIQPAQDFGTPPASAPSRSLSKRWWKRGTSKKEKTRLDDVSRIGSQRSLVMRD